MPQKISANHPDLPDDFPKEIIEPLARLFKIRQHIQVKLLPKDAWTICALIQFADRNPGLAPEHHELLRYFGDQLAEAVTNISPILGPYLELGWDPANDMPADKSKGKNNGV